MIMDLHLRCNQGYIEVEDLAFIELTDLVELSDLHIDGDGQNTMLVLSLKFKPKQAQEHLNLKGGECYDEH